MSERLEGLYELAKKYYPVLWDETRLASLVIAGRLSKEEVEQIISEVN